MAASSDPLPTELAGVSVVVNGIYAAIFSVAYANGQDQISFQVSFETDTGPNAAHIDILNFGTRVASLQSDSFVEDPGIFVYNTDGGANAIAARPAGYSQIGPRNRATPGEVLVLYTTGLGPVSLS